MSSAPTARAVLYLRVSTKEQAEAGGESEGYSIPGQREACHRKAEQLGAEVVDEYVDRGESARSANRPQLQAMLTRLAEDPVDFLIVHKIDRLARSRVDDVEINLALQQASVTLVSCTESIDETPSGILLHGIMSSIAEFYSRNLANEVIKGSTQKAKAGGTIGRAPVGYLNTRIVEDGREIRTVGIDPERAPLVRFAFEAYATGEWTLRKLLAEITRRGLRTRPSAKRPSKELGLAYFHKILTNPYYKGTVRYRGAEYPGRHDQLISERTWNKVQELLAANNKAGEKQRDHHHYLKGTVYCGTCGERLIVTKTTNRYGTVYPYFVCIGRQQRRTDCTQSAILISHVERLVEDHYLTVQPPADWLGQVRAFILDEITSQRELASHERRSQKRRINSLTTERKKLLDAHYEDAIPLDLLKSEQSRIASEIATATGRLEAVDLQYDTIGSNLDRAVEFASSWQNAYLDAEPSVRRRMNQAIFTKIYVRDNDDVRSEFAEPFEILLSDEVADATTASMELADTEIEARWSAIARTAETEATQDEAAVLDTTHPRQRRGLKYDTLVGPAGLEPATERL